MNLYKDLNTWSKENDTINCIVEIDMNSMVKYEFNKEANIIEVDRFFTTPMPIPYNYWLIPKTYNEEDKDPLDVIILSNYSINPWSICRWKVIWVLHMTDWWEMDDKIIVVPEKEPFYWEWEDISDIPKILRDKIDFFLNKYKEIDWKKTEVTWWSNKLKAIEIIRNCEESYAKMN